jgi:hypothetical protein
VDTGLAGTLGTFAGCLLLGLPMATWRTRTRRVLPTFGKVVACGAAGGLLAVLLVSVAMVITGAMDSTPRCSVVEGEGSYCDPRDTGRGAVVFSIVALLAAAPFGSLVGAAAITRSVRESLGWFLTATTAVIGILLLIVLSL